jgi:hypothetical protein
VLGLSGGVFVEVSNKYQTIFVTYRLRDTFPDVLYLL